MDADANYGGREENTQTMFGIGFESTLIKIDMHFSN
jgi:hypothetical protein